MRRILTAAALAAAASFALSGCASEPPAASAQASKYLADSGTRAAATPTPDPTVETRPALAKIQGMVKGNAPLVISVLGDSTGNSSGEWVDLWAEHLAEYGTVTLHLWDEKTGDWIAEPKMYPGGDRQVTIWNGSMPGSTTLYALARPAKIQPEKPTFQILNYGHNNLKQRADGSAADLIDTLKAQYEGYAAPTVITLQNPAVGLRAAQSASSVFHLRDWAGRVGYPVIDANKAITAAGNLPALILDDGMGVHPNPAGSRIWADTVIKTLG